MKRRLSVIITAIAMTGIVSVLSSCEEDCYTCRIIDPDNILDETGNSCDDEFVEWCEDMEWEFDDVTCTC